MPEKKYTVIEGIALKNPTDAYIDSSKLISVFIEEYLKKHPLDRRKVSDKNISSGLELLASTMKIFEKSTDSERKSKDYVSLARRLNTCYIHALDLLSGYTKKATDTNLANSMAFGTETSRLRFELEFIFD